MEVAAAGLDIGTSSIKLVIYGRKGPVYSAREPHSCGHRDGREFLPEILSEDVIGMLRAAAGKNKKFSIGAVGLSALYPSLVALDARGRPLTGIMTWLDEKGAAEALDFRSGGRASSWHKRTGCPAHESYPLWKLLWLKRHRPEIFRLSAKFLSLSDYLVYKLTGKYAASRAIASTTGLFNLKTLNWDKKAMALAGVSDGQFPGCFSIYHREPMLDRPRLRTGLPSGVVVVLGAGDGHLCNIGGGCGEGKVCSTVGVSSAVRVIGAGGYNPAAWRYYLYGNKYLSGIAANAGFGTLAWFAANILRENPRRLPGLISRMDPNLMTSLIFLPFLDGERGPGYNQGMAAAFHGLKSGHGRAEMFKAVLEGIFFSLYGCLEKLFEKERMPGGITATGGYARSGKMLQLQADIFGMRVHAPDLEEASAAGAAKVALTALGRIASPFSIKPRNLKTYFPDKQRHLQYMAKYAAYVKSYNASLSLLPKPGGKQ